MFLAFLACGSFEGSRLAASAALMWSQSGDWVDVKGSFLVKVITGAMWSEPVGRRLFCHSGARARNG